MRQHQARFEVETRGSDLYEVTDRVEAAVRESGVTTGLAVVYCRHTSAGLVIQENYDPAVRRDFVRWFERQAPESERYEHQDEGTDDMPSHLRAGMTRTSETIPIVEGRLALGTWQGVFLAEHRRRPHRREIVVHVTGE